MTEKAVWKNIDSFVTVNYPIIVNKIIGIYLGETGDEITGTTDLVAKNVTNSKLLVAGLAMANRGYVLIISA